MYQNYIPGSKEITSVIKQSQGDGEAFEIRVEVYYAQQEFNPDFRDWQHKAEISYERFPEAHADHRTFLEISNVLERAARKYDAKWSVERVRQESQPQDEMRAMLSRDVAHYDGAYRDLLSQIGILTSTAVFAVGLIKAVQPSLVQWLKNRGRGMLRVKVGTSEIAVRDDRDLDEILELLGKISSKDVPKTGRASKRPRKRSGGTKRRPASAKTKVPSSRKPRR